MNNLDIFRHIPWQKPHPYSHCLFNRTVMTFSPHSRHRAESEFLDRRAAYEGKVR